MDTLYTFWDSITHYKTESVHFLGLMNSATRSRKRATTTKKTKGIVQPAPRFRLRDPQGLMCVLFWVLGVVASTCCKLPVHVDRSEFGTC